MKKTNRRRVTAKKAKSKRQPKIEPRTGRPYRNPAVAEAVDAGLPSPKPLLDPKTGRFLPGNPTAWRKGDRPGPGGKKLLLSIASRKQLAVPLSPKDCKRLGMPDGSMVVDGIVANVARIALTGKDRDALAAAAEIRQATEGQKHRHTHETWRTEVEALGLDPDEVMQRIEALLESMVAEAVPAATD